jgi:hypothetical protein
MKTLHYFLTVAICSLLMASCGYPDHLKTLPKETVAVVSFDLAGMAAKGDLDKLQDAEFYKKLQAKMGEKDAETAKETDEFMKNPLNYGINFLEPVYLFVTYKGASEKPNVGFSIALGDAEKFKTFIAKVLKAEENGYSVESATGYSYLSTPEASFGWSEGTLIVLPSIRKDSVFDLTPVFASIFSEKGDGGSVVDMPSFKSYYKKSQDISGWISMDVIATILDAAKEFSPGLADEPTLKNYNEQMEKLKGSSFQFHITFNDDEIYTEYVTDLPSDLQKMYSEEVLRSGIPSKMSDLIKGTDLGVISLSLNLKNYLKMMSDNPAYDEKTKETMSQYVAAAQQFTAPFDGDLLFTLADVRVSEKTVTEQVPVSKVDDDELYASTDDYEFDWDTEYQDTTYTKTVTTPIFLAATTVNDESFGFLGMMLGKDKPKVDKLTTTTLGDFEFYTTIKDKVLIVGNDKASMEAILDGSYKGDNDSPMAKGAATHGIYVYANLDMTKYPKAVQDVIDETDDTEETAAGMKILGMLDKIEMYNKANYTAVVSVKLKPNGHNSLYTIIEHVGNAAYDLNEAK